MNLSDLCEGIRAKTGYPERGQTGTDRLKAALNYALRHIWGDMPEVMLAERLRFALEPVYSSEVYGEATKDALDNHVFTIAGNAFTGIDVGLLRGRWIELQNADGEWIQRRVQDVYYLNFQEFDFTYIIIDEPWISNAVVTLPWRIWTAEYPYPADVQKVRRCIIDPDGSSRDITPALYPAEMDAQRLGTGWRAEGDPDFYGSGKFFQLPAPHYKPTVCLANVVPVEPPPFDYVWGYEGYMPLGLQHNSGIAGGHLYGAAGTFSYVICHGWGRRKWLHPTKGWAYLAPFYLSAPSMPSDSISTVWAGAGIGISSPNLASWYGFGENELYASYEHCGLEKWIFRARHATETMPVGAFHPALSMQAGAVADSVYYLWRVIEGNATDGLGNYTTWDVGDSDPPDRQYPLKDFHGHLALVFDRTPTDEKQMALSVVRRPPSLMHDTDVPNIPPECIEALIALASAYLTGERDGDMDRKSYYYAEYLNQIRRFKKIYAQPGFAKPGFGDGITPRRSGSARMLDGKITWVP
jgi:hypothetical protein